ncbi:hypothetical protein HA402_007699 [Bradysia odoriphaga]|nr:hypothetical protein HA402_007699 [Bradysia odoriphaga]
MHFPQALCFIVWVFGSFCQCKHLTKILGGSNVTSAKTYPYQVSIQAETNFHVCGGSIIDLSWVLTAAHCSVQNDYQIVAGTVDRRYGVRKRISSVEIHPEYDGTHLLNDIALVRISGSFTFSNTIQPIRLADNHPPDDSIATVSGWGLVTNNGLPPNQLQALLVRVVGTRKCKFFWTTVMSSDHHICTLKSFGHGACLGDSGSPLQFNGEQVGIVSFATSLGCALGYPDIYTSVPTYKKWISEVTGIRF